MIPVARSAGVLHTRRLQFEREISSYSVSSYSVSSYTDTFQGITDTCQGITDTCQGIIAHRVLIQLVESVEELSAVHQTR